jgi:murein DD-endopeptidase MepM/ murein hydrolase activator NlpD
MTPQPTPFAVTLPPSTQAAVALVVSTAVPTADLSTLTPTPTATPTATYTPSDTPTATITDTPTPTLTLTPTVFISATPLPSQVVEDVPTWTPPPDNPATRIEDHYQLVRPIADGLTNWVDRTYPYGGTSGGRLQVHHGVEFVNPRGTVILAAGTGTVIHAGTDAASQYGPQLNYYGNLVVIQHDFSAPDGSPVYTLYGHMQTLDVATGQRIERGKKIGTIGDSGIGAS